MEVILLERVAKLGQMGEVVRVKDGFARNFLLKRGKALRATADNRAKYFSIDGAANNPKPIQKTVPITIGGSGEKVMLKLVAKYADRWNCPAGYQSFDHKFNVLKEHCKKVGRNLDEINISEQLLVCIGKNDAEVEQKWKAAQSLKPFSITGIKGTPTQLIEELKNRVKMGITTFTIFFSDFAPPPTLELFAKEVMPAFTGDSAQIASASAKRSA